MEIAFLGILVFFCMVLGLGYIVAQFYFSRAASRHLEARGDQALLLAERYLARIALAQGELAARNRRLQALTAQLDLSAQELARLNEMKSKFLSMVVHDVRSPLAAIKGFSQMLARKMPGEKEKKQFDNIVNSTNQLNHLITDLTDLAMIEAGKLSVALQPFDLGLIGQDHVPGLQVRSAETNVALIYNPPPGRLLVNGDRFRLGQVLMNLVTNALKFTPQGGTVTVTIAAEGGRAVVSVKDSGIGVHPSEIKKIFEKFYQAKYQKDDKLRKKGWGLGLSIAVEIIRAHGGEIAAASPGLGRGSTFYYSIPLFNG
jgi:signal transduction histidine kinase